MLIELDVDSQNTTYQKHSISMHIAHMWLHPGPHVGIVATCCPGLQFFDAVGWAAGRASGL